MLQDQEEVPELKPWERAPVSGYYQLIMTSELRPGRRTHRGKLVFAPAPRAAPNYQVALDGTEAGAARKKTARENGKSYLSVKLDLPFLAGSFNCAFMAQENGRFLVWGSDRLPRRGVRNENWPW